VSAWAINHRSSFRFPAIMDSVQRSTKPPDIAQDLPFGISGEDHGPEERSSSSITARGQKTTASRKVTSRGGGEQPEECRNVGELSRLPDIPLDILYEVTLQNYNRHRRLKRRSRIRRLQILSLVLPMDLLRTSWAGRALRTVLTNKSSKQVWAAAFGNIHEALQPPACPEDMSEIAYASLLYNPYCMVRGCITSRFTWLIRKGRVAGNCEAERIGRLV